MKLTPKLTLIFVLFAAALLGVVNFVGYNVGRTMLEAAAVAELQSTAGEKVATLNDWIEGKQVDLKTLANNSVSIDEAIALQTPLSNSLAASITHNRLLREFQLRVSAGEFLSVMLLDPRSGKVLVSTNPADEGTLKGDHTYFLKGKLGTYITPVYFSPELQAPALTASAPVLSADGQLLGVLTGWLNLAELNAIVQRRSGLRQTDDSFLVNSSHQPITQPRFLPDPVVLQQGIYTVPVNRCLEGQSGSAFANDYRNIPVIAVYRWLPDYQICMIVNISQAEALAQEHSYAVISVWIGLAALLIASVVAVGLSHTLIAPIRAMQTAAQRYGRGDLAIRLSETRQDELGSLAREFNLMAGSLAEQENRLRLHSLDLEQRVDKRTAEFEQSEERYRSLFENMISGYAYCQMIFEGDHPQDFIYLEVNKAFEALTGLRDVEGKKVSEVIPGVRESNSELFEVYGRVAFSGQPERLETYLKPLNIWFWISVYSPRQNYFVAIFDNITERKLAENALRESEEKFKYLFDHSLIGKSITHLDGKLAVNKAFCDMLGYSQDEMVDQKWQQITHPDDVDFSNQVVELLLAGEKDSARSIKRYLHKNGSTVWADVSISLRRDHEGKPLYFMTAVLDITERKQAEMQLSDALAFTEQVLTSSPVGIFTYQLSGQCLSANEAAAQMVGATVEQLKSQNFRELESWKQSGLLALAEQVIASKKPAAADLHVNTTFGKDAWYRAQFVTFRSAREELLLMIFNDITERKHAEGALQEKERLLSEAQHIGQIGSFSYDLSKNAFQFSDEMYHLLDILPEKFQHNSKDFLALVYPSDRLDMANWLADLRAGLQIKELDFRIFRQNGELRYLHCKGALEFDSDGRSSHFIGTIQDVSVQRVAEIQIDQQIKRLTALSEIDRAIISGLDQQHTLGVILSATLSQLQVDAADILLLDPGGQVLNYAAGQGFQTRAMEETHVQLGESQAGRIAMERHLIRIPNLNEHTHDPIITRLATQEKFVSYIGVPLIVKREVKGVLEVFHRSFFQPYQEWLDFLNTLAGQTAIALENASLLDNLKTSNQELAEAYDAILEGWSHALDLRDRETEGHSQRVTALTEKVARAMGIDESQLTHIRRGALLHDIGKLGIPDRILFKPDKLSPEEWEIMQKHPEYAYEMLSSIRYLKPALPIPYFHHEKWDGSGYPLGLRAEHIPLEARIFAVVDVWDALLSDRPYRKAWTVERTLEHIRTLAGIHFDPNVVACFMKIMKP